MTLPVLLSFLFVLLGLVACVQSGRSRLVNSLILGEALACLFLLIGYALANHFTGEGINTAVWYHVRYGLAGAGFKDYQTVMIVTASALLAAPFLVGGAVAWRREKPRRVAFLSIGQLLLISAWIANPGVKDLLALSRRHSPATEDFFRHFQPATMTSVSSEHRSFVFIFAESLEHTYFDEQRFPGLITQLRDLESRGTSFTNIHTLEGTGFTMGGMVGAICGVPLFTPAHGNSMRGMDGFLTGAVGVTDLLHDQGYFISFLGGAQLDFAGKRKFLSSHHFEDSAGFSELHGHTKDRTYINNWGLYDDTMFDFAFDRVTELAGQRRPFGLFLLTLDTHPPDGHLSKSVTSGSYGDGRNPMLNAIKGSDELIGRFVHRLWASPAGKDLVVVIVSDHIAMENTASDLLKRGERRNMFLILDPRNPKGTRIDRSGSTLDIGATILPTLGFKGRINLGRDLRDPTTSDAELLHIQKAETLLSWRPEIIQLWEFPRFTKSLSFDPETSLVKIDNRQFLAPVLVELGEANRTTLRFEFDSLDDTHLAEQATKLAPGTPYLLIVKPEDAQSLLKKEPAPITAPWVMISETVGKSRTLVPLPNAVTFSKQQVEDLLKRRSRAGL